GLVAALLLAADDEEERGRELASVVLEREWRHRQADVLGEQSDDRVDVARRERARESRDHLALDGGVRSGRRLAIVLLFKPTLQRGACAFERAGDGLRGRLED